MAGAFWYLISVERQDTCWHEACDFVKKNGTIGPCIPADFYCDNSRVTIPNSNISNYINDFCALTNPDNIPDLTTTPPFNFGIFIDALQSRIVGSNGFRKKLFYCFWWGFRNLSSLGQNLKTSTFTGEIVFAIGLSISGLVLFALLIGNMQTYLQSLSGREEVRRGDAEEWMLHRRLPVDIKNKVRHYEQSKWQLTRGVDEEDLTKNFPNHLRREIYGHLWEKIFVNPLKKVPIFKEMDRHLKDEMFDVLKPVIFTKKTTITEVGAPVDEILFITKGCMRIVNERGGGGSYFGAELKVGDFFGEELVAWACNPNCTSNELPRSTRKVVTKTQLEAYALTAEEFKSIASKFMSSLDSKRVEQTVKFLSMDWRTQAASAIQKAWQQRKNRKLEKDLHQAEQAHGH